jgi:putative hemolysin
MNVLQPCKKLCMMGLVLLAPIMLLFASCSTAGNTVEKPAAKIDCEKISPANPAASYCTLLGYSYERMTTASGDAIGACKFPDGSTCPQWDFYAGKCGQQYSYCAQKGYQVKTGTDGNDPYSSEYSVCVDDQEKEIGSATQLSGLAEAINACR